VSVYKKLNATDAFFLQVESADSPMHVATLSRFQLPKGKSQKDILKLVEGMRKQPVKFPPFNLKLAKTSLGKWNPAWTIEEDIDIDYHIRHSALPQPGGERELAVLISRLHSIPLDQARPMWEAHVIEGFADGSFALYVKMHHALIDGVAGARMLQRAMSTKPTGSTWVPFWAIAPEARPASTTEEKADRALQAFFKEFGGQLGSVRKVTSSLVKLFLKNDKDLPNLVAPYQAPECVLNGPIGPQRRVSTQDFALADIKAIARASGGTLNDVVMAICGGTIRTYLSELGELPREPLIAQVPVSIRPDGDQDGGNAISSILASLGTNEADTRKRFEQIKASMDDGKTLLKRLSKAEIASYSTLLMAPFAVGQVARIGNRSRRPMYNLVISNVPGPKEKLFMGSAALVSCHPVSLVFQGQALNITIFTYADTLSIVYTACRRSLPHVQYMVAHAEQAFADLQEAFLA
jgi:diacylglycerol O-acyltransferase